MHSALLPQMDSRTGLSWQRKPVSALSLGLAEGMVGLVCQHNPQARAIWS